MGEDARKKELEAVFSDVDPNEKMLVSYLIGEVVYLEKRMADLKKLPPINTHPQNHALQKSTPAAKQYKECMQSYMNALRILVNVLRKVEVTAQDELLKKLEEFSL